MVKKDFLNSAEECNELLCQNPTVSDVFMATSEFNDLYKFQIYFILNSIEDAYKKKYEDSLLLAQAMVYDKIYETKVPYEKNINGIKVYNYIGSDVSREMVELIVLLEDIVEKRGKERESVGLYAMSKDYKGDLLLTFLLFEGLNGTGHNVFVDTKNMVSLCEELYKLGYSFRLSDASYDMADDVSTFAVQVFFDKEGKPKKGKYKMEEV